jgi:hypothetical protein
MAVCIEAFSLSGKLLSRPLNKIISKGNYKTPIDLTSISSQTVLVRMQRGSQVESFRIVQGPKSGPVSIKIMGSKNAVETKQSLLKETTTPIIDTLVFERVDLGTLRIPLDSCTTTDSIRVTATSIIGALADNSIGTNGTYKVALFTSNWYWDWGTSQVIASKMLSSADTFSINAFIPAEKYFLMAYRDADGNGSYTYNGNTVDPMGEYSTTSVAITATGLINANITITPRSISGTVSGAPSGWKVKASDPGVDKPIADIAADGGYVLKLYREGAYSLSAYDPNGAAVVTYPQTIDLSGNNTVAQNINIVN